ncbi:methyl-accepting chemotaxis protein [Xylophilus sp.]|uniref:methyl-accepting chemotaxis protein n=1 Tax=Xylophilus sp. TaxID=2653893 RepID=UPI0013BC5093|nr:methyl-accepting chemotaxis protein [Xylophilus sp.]KAF1049763.1 MAG: Methyl-accepting chemotaxis protein 1 [Xylophilus sp.]
MTPVWNFIAGMLAGGLAAVPWLLRLRARLEAHERQVQSARRELAVPRAEADMLRAELAAQQAAHRQAAGTWEQRWSEARADRQAAVQDVLGQADRLRGVALGHARELAAGITDLYGAEKTFERWHDDMKVLLDHNRGMHHKNDEFSHIVRQMVIVALNASIEAARAGATGRGFSIVANEMRSLSARAEALSADYRRTLYENDLITTTTFQDMQAGGRMILGAVRSLELVSRKNSESLALPAAAFELA